MYLYSNIIGTFVFNQNFQIREKVIFSKKDLYENLEKLKNNETLDSEKVFLVKFKKIKNLREEPDEKYMDTIYEALSEYMDEFYNNNLLLTKFQVKESVSDDMMIIQASSSINELNKSINNSFNNKMSFFILNSYNKKL